MRLNASATLLATPGMCSALTGRYAAPATSSATTRATVADARVAGREARITVRFDADVAAVTRDAEGRVIAGSTDDAVETHDVWTFVRTLGAPDPNWKLADTDEA